jgi:rRNA-processing protein FCF1
VQIIVVDTSAIVSVFESGLNIDRELDGLIGDHDIIVPLSAIQELSVIRKKEARSAERLASNFRTVETSSKGDDAIIEAARRFGAFAVMTNDMRLAKELASKGYRVIILRGKRRLDFFRSDEAL